MKLSSLLSGAALLLIGMLLLGTPLFVSAQPITSGEVQRSLEENGTTCRSKIDALAVADSLEPSPGLKKALHDKVIGVCGYATNLPEVVVGALMAGIAPSQDLLRLDFTSTGGLSHDKNDWKNWVVGDSHGKAIVFNLPKGAPELRLTRPTGALALDRFVFKGTGLT